MSEYSVEEVKALDGKIFAMLTDHEKAVFDFYRKQGRKYGVSATVQPTADIAGEVAAASNIQADDILRRTNSRVLVSVATG